MTEEGSTVTGAPPWRESGSTDVQTALHLVIAWASLPGRLGEAAAVSRRVVLGRGAARADDPAPRLRFVRQRPGSNEPTPMLDPERMSRVQLVLAPEGKQGLSFERVGKCALLHNGMPVDRGIAHEGDILTLTDAVTFLVERRPKLMPAAWRAEPCAGARFGDADQFGTIGESPYVWELRARLASIARDADPVLVLGPSGVGKELVARAIHGLSARRDRDLVARNAATIPPALFDAELFGTQRNYPNAGTPERPGLIGAAEGGTLYLDEIGELGAEQQAHLLRFLDSGEYHRLGEGKGRRADVRVVAATNREPSELKHDLLARFAKRIDVRGLDARLADLPLLVSAITRESARAVPAHGRFLERVACADGSTLDQARVHPALIEALLRHDFSTHFRELRRLVGLSLESSPGEWLVETPPVSAELKLIRSIPTPDAAAIGRALGACGGNVTQAAKALGLSSRYALLRLMRRNGVELER
jgi:DNA-binding NtrC family response regulator